MDESVYSGAIEGAFTTKKEARELIRDGCNSKNKSAQVVKNNYEVLTDVLEHIDEPIAEQTIFDIYAFVTKNTMEIDVPTGAYCSEKVFVRSGRGEIVHTAPEAEKVPGKAGKLKFAKELLRFLF